jgi:hypothetical protein
MTGLALTAMLCLLAFTTAPASTQDGGAGQIQQTLERAEQQYQAGSLQEARRLLSEVIERLDRKDAPKGGEALLVRALYYRGRVLADLNDRDAGARDVERLLTLAPETRIDESLVGRAFADLFRSVSARTLTELEIAVVPRDAEVRVGDRPVDQGTGILALRPGKHVVTAARAGYEEARREVELPPGGRVRLDLELQPLSETLPAPRRWSVFHLHAGTFCGGRLSIDGNRLVFGSVSDESHSFSALLTDVREVQGNKMLVGGLKYGGSFHVRFARGGNYNFVSDGFPAAQLVTLLQAAVDDAKRKR